MAEVDPGRFPIDAFEHDVDDSKLYIKTGWTLQMTDADTHFTAVDLEAILAEIGTRLEALE